MAEITEDRALPARRVVYVLRLSDECFYIGQSRADCIEKRIKKHFKGKGSAWTKLHSPIEVVEQFEVYGSYRDGELQENEKTIEYMRRYGLSKVRGGFFSNTDETVLVKNLKSHGVKL